MLWTNFRASLFLYTHVLIVALARLKESGLEMKSQ
jgi:hypothetical protein